MDQPQALSQAARIVAKFGGLTATSKALGHKNPTTVQGWVERGYIPSRRHDELLAAAKRSNVDLKPEDFFASQAA